jgi:hypothetical protein
MDLERFSLLVALSLTTLTLVLAFGIYQRIRVARAKKKEEHSAFMEDNHVTYNEPKPVEGRAGER